MLSLLHNALKADRFEFTMKTLGVSEEDIAEMHKVCAYLCWRTLFTFEHIYEHGKSTAYHLTGLQNFDIAAWKADMVKCYNTEIPDDLDED